LAESTSQKLLTIISVLETELRVIRLKMGNKAAGETYYRKSFYHEPVLSRP
jgi:hypothetical protein